MKTVDNISLEPNYSLVTFQSIPSDICFISKVFDILSNSGINIDMISQSPNSSSYSNFSFTVKDEDIVNLLPKTKQLSEDFNKLNILVSNGNTKISLGGEKVKNCPGVAATIFGVLASMDVDLKLITTSDTEISILIESHVAEAVYDSLSEAFRTDTFNSLSKTIERV